MWLRRIGQEKEESFLLAPETFETGGDHHKMRWDVYYEMPHRSTISREHKNNIKEDRFTESNNRKFVERFKMCDNDALKKSTFVHIAKCLRNVCESNCLLSKTGVLATHARFSPFTYLPAGSERIISVAYERQAKVALQHDTVSRLENENATRLF